MNFFLQRTWFWVSKIWKHQRHLYHFVALIFIILFYLGIALVCKHFNKLFKSPKMPIKKITLSISENSRLLLNRKARQNAFMAIERARCLETLIIDDGNETAGVPSWQGHK